jgi:molybdopterin-containing oxidoreductase family iron-sulfur binding subunit
MSCGSKCATGCAGGSGRGCADSGGDRVDAERRSFMRGAGASVMSLAAGVTLYTFGVDPVAAREPGGKVSAKNRWGLLIDVSKCVDGCNKCVTACQTENGWRDTGNPETDAQWIRTLTVKNPKNGTTFSLPMMCQHCANPPCVDVCPTGASFKRADGIVLVDKHTCIGCRYCMMACPYKARSFVHEPLQDQKPYAPRGKGTVESCTLCVHRVDSGRIPACVEACNDTAGGAMLFGDLNDPSSDIAKRVAELRTTRIRTDLGTDPGVYYRNI